MKTSRIVLRIGIAFCLLGIAGGIAGAGPRDGTSRDGRSHDGRPLVQIALLLDTSNSMDGLINQAKSQLWKIVSEAGKMTQNGRKVRLEVALYEYGNDSLSILSGYVRRVMPFTDDLDELSARLFELDTYGGSEYCGTVIKKGLDELDWSDRESDLKIAYVAGNEPFDQGSVDFRDAGRRAVRRGVVVNTIFCGGRDEGIAGFWAEGARVTGGAYLNIEGDYEYGYIPCPQDDRLSELNSRLNDTYIAYGAQGSARKSLQMEQDVQAEELNKEGFFERAKVKSSASYSNSNWDLVDATSSGAVPLASIKDAELPEQMRTMPKEAREAYVAGKHAERKKIQEEIAALSSEREAWLEENKATVRSDKALDTAILAPLGEAARKKGFVPGK